MMRTNEATSDWREGMAANQKIAPFSPEGLFEPLAISEPPHLTDKEDDDEKESNLTPQLDSETHNKDDPFMPSGWKRYRVYASEIIPEDEPLLKVGEYTILSRGNIQTVYGKAKSCKTFFTSAMAGAALAGEYLGMTAPGSPLKVLMFDTEQGRSRTQKVERRINNMCGLRYNEDCENLITVSVRELDPEKRKEMLADAMAEIKPDLVILDGVRDMLSDFNDVKTSAELVNVLMKLSVEYDCAIVTVIHQNKNDLNARGHLGGELMNKSETAMEIARSNKISTVKPAYCRNVEFDDFSFRINDKGLPERCDTPVQTEEDKTEQLRQLIIKAMFGTTQMKKADLAKKLAEILNKHQKTGTRRINEAVAAGILTEQPDGSVSLTPDDNPEEEDLLPF